MIDRIWSVSYLSGVVVLVAAAVAFGVVTPVDVSNTERTAPTAGNATTDTPDAGAFAVDVVGTTRPVEAGETVDVTVEIENTGDLSHTGEVALRFDGRRVAAEDVSLEGGDSATLTFSPDTSDVVPGEYTASVRTADASESVAVSVTEPPEDAFLAMNVSATNAPVEEGETLNVTAAVENTGDREAVQEIALAVGDEVVETRAVTVGAGERESVALSYRTGTRDAGERTITVTSADDAASTTATVTDLNASEIAYWQVDFGAGANPPTPPTYWPDDVMAALGNSVDGVTDNPSLLRQENESQLGAVTVVDREFQFDDEGDPTAVTVEFELAAGAEARNLHLAAYTLPGPFDQSELGQQRLFDAASGTYGGGETGELTVAIPQSTDATNGTASSPSSDVGHVPASGSPVNPVRETEASGAVAATT